MQELIVYTNDAPALPEERKSGWLLIGRGKLKMEQRLQGQELALQSILTGYEKLDIVTLAEKIAAYKKDYLTLVDTRKEFTAMLDTVKDGCMVIEKRADPKVYAPFVAAVARELQLRIDANKKLKEANDLNTEKASFIAHFQNEYMEISAEFRQQLSGIIHQAYTSCLIAKTPVNEVHVAIELATAAINDSRHRGIKIFPRVLIDIPTANQIYSGIPYPNFPEMKTEAIAALEEKFSMYANDLEAAEVIVQQETVSFNAALVESAKDVQQATAANTLLASAGAFTAAPSGLKTVKEKTEIVIEDDNAAWVATIIAAFLANFQKAFAKITVKKYSALTVKQMAAALDKAEVTVQGVRYQTAQS